MSLQTIKSVIFIVVTYCIKSPIHNGTIIHSVFISAKLVIFFLFIQIFRKNTDM